ncbi:MAG: hypothetical protein AAF720_04220 [Pseudomonadota bacterium]
MTDIATLFEPISKPAGADRRLINRFSAAWIRASRGDFPSWDELRKIDMGSDWNWVFVVDLAKSNGFPHFSYLGSNLAQLADIYLVDGSEWTVSVLDRASQEIGAAVANEGPHAVEDTLTLSDGRPLLFRCLTAPLAEDGLFITKVVGIVSGRLSSFNENVYTAVNDLV